MMSKLLSHTLLACLSSAILINSLSLDAGEDSKQERDYWSNQASPREFKTLHRKLYRSEPPTIVEVKSDIRKLVRRYNGDCSAAFEFFDIRSNDNILDEDERMVMALLVSPEENRYDPYEEYVSEELILRTICSGSCTKDVFKDAFCPPQGSGKGDPHFMTWYGNHFSYHGACDLVFIHNPRFSNWTGLDLHIRTEHMMNKAYSFISNAALRIGNDVLEVIADGRHFINGNIGALLPANIGGYPVNKVVKQTCRGNQQNKKCWNSMIFIVTLGEQDMIQIKVASEMVHVDVIGTPSSVKGSVGLMGTYPAQRGGKFARDGTTFVRNPDTFAQHWQVLNTEPKLFQGTRYPQHPEKCIPSVAPAKEGRHLRHVERNEDRLAAEDACSHVTGPDWEFCVTDVMATGDYGMAATVYDGL